VGRLFFDEQETIKPPSNPPVTSCLGNGAGGSHYLSTLEKSYIRFFQ